MSFIKMATGFLVIGVGLGLAKIMKLSASKQVPPSRPRDSTKRSLT